MATTTPANASTGYKTQIGVIAGEQLYPRSADEITAGVTPTDYSYPVGNVLRYGADPTGVANSTTAFTNARDVRTTGESIYVPHGIYKVDALNMGEVGIVGEGLGRSGVREVKDHASWAIAANFSGTILRSTVSSGYAIKYGPSTGNWNRARTEGFCLIGENSNTAVGLEATFCLTAYIANVRIGNFATCIDATGSQDCLYSNVGAYGCTTGLTIGAVTNQNIFINTQFSGCVTAMNLTAGSTNTFYGGLIQKISGDGILMDGPVNYTFDSFWMEPGGTITGSLISILGSSTVKHTFTNFNIQSGTAFKITLGDIAGTTPTKQIKFEGFTGGNQTTLTINANCNQIYTKNVGDITVDETTSIFNEIHRYGYPQYMPSTTAADLGNSGAFVNNAFGATAKVLGAVMYNTTDDCIMTAQGSGATDTWVGYGGAVNPVRITITPS